MANKRKNRVRALSERTGMSYQAANNVLGSKLPDQKRVIEDLGLLGFFKCYPILTKEAIYQGGRHWLRLSVRKLDGTVEVHTLSVNEDSGDMETSPTDPKLETRTEKGVPYEVLYTRLLFEADKNGYPKPLHESTLRTIPELRDFYQTWANLTLSKLPIWQRSRPKERLCGVEFGGRVVWFPVTLLKKNELEYFGAWYMGLPKGEAVFDDIPRATSVAPSE